MCLGRGCDFVFEFERIDRIEVVTAPALLMQTRNAREVNRYHLRDRGVERVGDLLRAPL